MVLSFWLIEDRCIDFRVINSYDSDIVGITFIGCNCLSIGGESVCEFDDDKNDSCVVRMGKLWWICVWDKPSSGVLLITMKSWINKCFFALNNLEY